MKRIIITAACLLCAVLLFGCSRTDTVLPTTEAPGTTAASTEEVAETAELSTEAAATETISTETTSPETEAAKETTCSHNYRFKVTKEPTCAASGEKLYTCTRCGASYKEVLEPLAHSYVKTTKAPDCVNPG